MNAREQCGLQEAEYTVVIGDHFFKYECKLFVVSSVRISAFVNDADEGFGRERCI